MAKYDDLNTPNLTLIGLCSAVGTFVSVIALQVLYYQYEKSENVRKVVNVPQVNSDSILNDQRSRLASYGWIDRDEKIVQVPIDEAMSLVIAREQKALTKDTADAN